MKYTSFAVALLGCIIAAFGGCQFFTAEGPGQSENPFPWRLVLSITFATALMVAAAMMWIFGGEGYTAGKTQRIGTL
ncbi:hypothetical protein [Limnoglobus roseus]|uniref:Uncharacterized protein n=1 Tax=Limnoglobus roseus TaxID=2598579 RepID=A0A5C1AMN9_9BACT|nr:hypothetical protein [Limnoglobus roseus]QEL20511.1 hypothetical protein PX52LOC_07615 [Limnoglobus roseus]